MTRIEVIVGVAIFAIILTIIVILYASGFDFCQLYRYETIHNVPVACLNKLIR